MDNIFEVLFNSVNSDRIFSAYEMTILKDIEKNSLILKKHLSKKEKKILLRIIDNEGLLLEASAIRNFTTGFKLGIRLGVEVGKE